uniref:Large ribosomal subunit protein bL32c n=1 Tax=Monotropastrum sciaphilum TaxID=1223319 RepID=A0A2D3C317_9ERIC|nr:ribosomal protein L32 [Monotropastrum sciaphilum]
MGVPKKRTSISKKSIRKNIWKKKGYLAYLKAVSLGKSIFTGNSKSFGKGSHGKATEHRKYFWHGDSYSAHFVEINKTYSIITRSCQEKECSTNKSMRDYL